MVNCMPKRKPISKKQVDVAGEKVTVHTYEYSKKKEMRNARSNTSSCPNCLSTLKTNDSGFLYCTGNKLIIWEKDFAKYHAMKDIEKAKYLSKISNTSKFEELYDYWRYAFENNDPAQFDCGYTNNVSLPIGSSKSRIPDPIVCKRLETSLGRKLTEEELYGESPLYSYRGKILTEYKKRAKEVKIPWILLPDLVEIKI